MDNLSRQTSKGYQLRELAGAGGFGAGYRACQPLLEREVAIKIIPSLSMRCRCKNWIDLRLSFLKSLIQYLKHF